MTSLGMSFLTCKIKKLSDPTSKASPAFILLENQLLPPLGSHSMLFILCRPFIRVYLFTKYFPTELRASQEERLYHSYLCFLCSWGGGGKGDRVVPAFVELLVVAFGI